MNSVYNILVSKSVSCSIWFCDLSLFPVLSSSLHYSIGFNSTIDTTGRKWTCVDSLFDIVFDSFSAFSTSAVYFAAISLIIRNYTSPTINMPFFSSHAATLVSSPIKVLQSYA